MKPSKKVPNPGELTICQFATFILFIVLKLRKSVLFCYMPGKDKYTKYKNGTREEIISVMQKARQTASVLFRVVIAFIFVFGSIPLFIYLKAEKESRYQEAFVSVSLEDLKNRIDIKDDGLYVNLEGGGCQSKRSFYTRSSGKSTQNLYYTLLRPCDDTLAESYSFCVILLKENWRDNHPDPSVRLWYPDIKKLSGRIYKYRTNDWLPLSHLTANHIDPEKQPVYTLWIGKTPHTAVQHRKNISIGIAVLFGLVVVICLLVCISEMKKYRTFKAMLERYGETTPS